MSPVPPRRWTANELAADSRRAGADFRQERLDEPLALWKTTFRACRTDVRRLFRELDMRHPVRPHSSRIADLHAQGLGDVLRYLSAPPISEDDLKALVDSPSLAVRTLRQKPHVARSVLRTALLTLDPVRFPWVHHGTVPRGPEWRAAIDSTSALMAVQRVATARRHSGKNNQEQAARAYLASIGLVEVAPRRVDTFYTAPAPGEFCGECEVAGRKADIVVRMFDGRLLLIECKVSNSAVNSVKRVNNDAGAKAAAWIQRLGDSQVVPAALLSGVFKVLNLDQAQDLRLTLFWAHRLSDIGDFIQATSPGSGDAPSFTNPRD